MNVFVKLTITAVLLFCYSCKEQENGDSAGPVIGSGGMPHITKDKANGLHVVYGSGDSIMYTFSNDDGKTFGAPALVAVLPKLAASHTRGPQIAATANGVLVTACNALGNIFCYRKEASGPWSNEIRVNDMDTVAKENLMALSADGENAFAVWLDLRDGHNRIYGSKSEDGGKTWLKNNLIYASPDTTVCECCKPSVVMKDNTVYVMFRNWLKGARDMYISSSADGGNTFAKAQKLGAGTWKLNACPMDGGGLALGADNRLQTVWYRNGTIYAGERGNEETEIGKGRNSTIETVNGKTVYAWTETGNLVVLMPQGIKENLGKGQSPVLKAINNEYIICVWEKDKQIHTALLKV